MLAKKYRLAKEKDFRSVFQKGRGFFLGELGVKCAPNGLALSRFGISVSLKISKKAVLRNRLKRQTSEIIRLKLKEIKPGYDFVVITRPGILDLDYKKLEEKLDFIFKKLGALKK